ncbi:MAG TPA: flagellar hook-length control protein FliK [Thiohalobacter sp.]|nr:flagellar hook-length control protein FliK [Thiohalobacter sp.]
MQPSGSGLPPLPPTQPGAKTAATAATWRVGQVLQGRVVRESSQGQTPLQIGRQRVQAHTGSLQLSPGQSLRLEVVSLSRDLPVLRLLDTLRQDTVSQALRQILPAQRPLSQPLTLLNQLAALPDAARGVPQLSQLMRSFLLQLPDPARVGTPEGLRQALTNSGLFLEGKLARAAAGTTGGGVTSAQTALQGDFKAGLLQLAAGLRQAAGPAGVTRAPATAPPPAPAPPLPQTAPPPAMATAAGRTLPLPALDSLASLRPGMPPRPQAGVDGRTLRLDLAQLLQRGGLLQQVESALSRVKLNQLASLPQERQQPPEWLVELPVRRGEDVIDVWGLRLRREGGHGGSEAAQGGAGWTLMLAFDLPGLGPVQARVSLSGERHISTRFLSEQGEPLRRLSEHLPRLRARLEQSGLVVQDLDVKRGRLREPPAMPSRGPLLDDQA